MGLFHNLVNTINLPLYYVGVFFSIVASTEVLSVLIASAFYNTVYPLTLKHGLKSGTAYFLMAFLFLIPVPLVL